MARRTAYDELTEEAEYHRSRSWPMALAEWILTLLFTVGGLALIVLAIGLVGQSVVTTNRFAEGVLEDGGVPWEWASPMAEWLALIAVPVTVAAAVVLFWAVRGAVRGVADGYLGLTGRLPQPPDPSALIWAVGHMKKRIERKRPLSAEEMRAFFDVTRVYADDLEAQRAAKAK